MADNKLKEVGALWRKEDKNGKAYYNGTVTVDGKSCKIMIFKNEYKDSDNKPDLRIYLATQQ